jgi:hypothetical protein
VKWDSETVPSKEFPFRFKYSNSISDPMLVGISPISLLLERYNVFKDERVERSGREP